MTLHVDANENRRVCGAFVTNFCAHYRVKTFETLARYQNVDFFFCSAGEEWYWQQNHGVRRGEFRHAYLPGRQITQRVRLVPSLITRLWQKKYDVYIKCINGRFELPVTYLIARLRQKPFILWTGIWMSLDTPFHRFAFPLTLWVYRHADAIVAYGEHVKRYLIGLKVAPEKIFVAPHAMDNSQYSGTISRDEKMTLRKRYSLVDQKLVLYLGRLEEEKGVEYLVQAFARLKNDNTALLIVGEGSSRSRLEALVTEKSIWDKTRFMGYVAPEQAMIYYAIADCFVLPSVTMPTGKEPWGLVINEAMNQGVPVVATDAVGAAAGGLVQNGVNGFVVPERDSKALAEAIGRILNDDELRAKMSWNARRIIAGWDNERMVQGFQQAIAYALDKGNHTSIRRRANHYGTLQSRAS
ncbi:MAG: glycosyltransferase family 4 protein [Candidatus Binatia bacterium]